MPLVLPMVVTSISASSTGVLEQSTSIDQSLSWPTSPFARSRTTRRQVPTVLLPLLSVLRRAISPGKGLHRCDVPVERRTIRDQSTTAVRPDRGIVPEDRFDVVGAAGARRPVHSVAGAIEQRDIARAAEAVEIRILQDHAQVAHVGMVDVESLHARDE